MSILKSIFDKIFHSAHADTPAKKSPQQTPPVAQSAPAQAQVSSPAPSITPVPNLNTQISEIDVGKILTDMASNADQPLNWRTSIVDLLKLLNLDSSIQSRKQLAQELGYSGDMNDSATMNVWLHKQVMQKLAANGGKVPASLKD